jgi:hypothetical protein
MYELRELTGVEAIRISDCFKKPLDAPDDEKKPLSAGVIYRDWKSEAEPKGIEELGNRVKQLRDQKSDMSTLVINTHFATYSPGGYMIGLDPPSLRQICIDCMLCKPDSKGKAAVVLVDIGIGDVLQRREEQWKKKEQWEKPEDVFPTGPGLAQDLEFNRLYALQYYNTLNLILKDAERVIYYRSFVDYKQIKDLTGDLRKTSAFQQSKDKLIHFLKEQRMIP